MMQQPGTLQTADAILRAIGGIDALISEASQTAEPKTIGWFTTTIASKLTRSKKMATSIAGVEASRLAHAAYLERQAVPTA